MRGISRTLAVACAALACWAAPAAAATQKLTDVPAGFWAGRQITWAVKNGWITPRTPTLYGVKHTVSRRTASYVLARLNMRRTGQPIAPDPYAQAVAAGWISAGTGFTQPRSRSARWSPPAAGGRRCRTASASSRSCGRWGCG
jgi:hypothetical protein